MLSNNDGCIIARSNEAKALGIPMGAPYYRYKQFFKTNNVNVFSSNYELYGDMSQRIMYSLRELCPDMEVYSIDEAFLQLEGFQNRDLTAYALDIRQKIKKWVGIPVSIGIAPTKTLAKIANYVAKHNTQEGVFNLMSKAVQDSVLASFEVKKIWGIAAGREDKLKRLGIYTARDLRDANAQAVRKHLTVMGERTVYELRGTSCISLEAFSQPKKNIISSRSFGCPVTQCEDLEEALANYAARAAKKMRKQKSRAQAVHVSVTTNPFNASAKQYQNSASCRFIAPTSDTSQIISIAAKCLHKIYKPGYVYKKVSVMLMDLIPDTDAQQDLFCEVNYEKPDKMMSLLDAINVKMGDGKLFIGAQGINRAWKMQRGRQSPRYTTQWGEVLLLR